MKQSNEVIQQMGRELAEELYKATTPRVLHTMVSILFLLSQAPVEDIVEAGPEEMKENLYQMRLVSQKTLNYLKENGVDWFEIALKIRERHGLVDSSDRYAEILNNFTEGTIQ